MNVDKGAKFTMNSGTLGEEFSVVVESQDNSVTSDTVANLINGTYNKIQIKTNKSDVNISGGSYTDIVGYSDSKGSYTPNSGDASVTGGTFRNNVNEFATVNYVVSGSRGYTYFNDFDKAMAYAGVGDDIDFIGSSTTRTHTVRFYYENNVYDVYEVVHDDEVELPTGQYDGKRIDGWKRDDGKVFKPGDDVTITRNTDFTVILRNGQYNIVIDDDIKHGDVSTDVSSADKGATVYIYVDPDIGYVLDDLNVYYGANNRYSVTVSYVRAGVYKFTMPNASVYITATFKYAALPFTDVNRSQWFYDEVYYVYTNGMMEGDSATTFNPDGRMTRAMFWAVLGRIDGATITGNDWAEEARAWAMREGVSDGTNPNDYVTREQMVTMLWRYAGEKNGSASLIRYTDADKISSYAVEAMRWAIGNGIIEGMTSTTLEPQGTATRAQCAAIFMRFDQM
ncbi:MAG TPA: S-layer homology domain-containing protein [Candidatus Scatomorpha gallistercoris]|nr:S-layer homology domain-containing protein [Candidatus Scatomorpha gallistercoris]